VNWEAVPTGPGYSSKQMLGRGASFRLAL